MYVGVFGYAKMVTESRRVEAAWGSISREGIRCGVGEREQQRSSPPWGILRGAPSESADFAASRGSSAHSGLVVCANEGIDVGSLDYYPDGLLEITDIFG